MVKPQNLLINFYPGVIPLKTRTDDFIYVSSQNQGDTGTVTTTIYIDGDVFKTSNSSGAYVRVSAYSSIS